MKKRILLLTLVCFCFSRAFSQKNLYEKGYFIDNNNKKVECWIKNEEWDNNPTQFEYKSDENATPKIMQFIDFNEFEVGGEYKFIKSNVKIDKSNDNNRNEVSSIKAMNFVEDFVLLRVRIEGKATLYSFTNSDYLRFFYRKDSNQITPLSYKLYYNQEEYAVAKNETYKQELLNALKCETITQSDVNNLEYLSSSLSDFFIKYNACSGSTVEKFANIKNHNSFELYAKAGLGISSFSYDYAGYSADFSKKTSLKFGLEAEINLSNKFKKWSILFEALYRNYSNSYEFDFLNPVTAKLDYTALDISFGVRRYFVLNQNASLFLNGYATYGYPLDSVLKNTHTSDLIVTGSFSPTLSLGYIFDKKYCIELRYEFNRNLFTNADSKFSTIGFTVGYKFL